MSPDVYTVAITDDEPIAREILAGYIARFPDLRLVAECAHAMETLAALNRCSVDILFMDINMPEISGMQLVRSLEQPPLVIFTTAYSEYAVESYELAVVDYLLKPIPFARFARAIDKARSILELRKEGRQEEPLLFRSDGKWIRLMAAEILMVEGLKDYVRICTSEGRWLVHCTMKYMEEQLSAGGGRFLRVHRSYIVNLGAATELSATSVLVGKQKIPIGSTYRDEFLAAIAAMKKL